jgi:hypothetical protein
VNKFVASLFIAQLTACQYNECERLKHQIESDEAAKILEAWADSEISQYGIARTNAAYSYVRNNPMISTDPTGNFPLRQALGVVVGVVAAIQWVLPRRSMGF